MKNLFGTALLVLVMLVAATEVADAQAPTLTPRFSANRFRRPTTNPYLDLLSGNRGSRSFSHQYFRSVRPELEFRRHNSRFGQDLRRLRHRIDQQQSRQLTGPPHVPPTGHTPRFMSHGGYYRFSFRPNGR